MAKLPPSPPPKHNNNNACIMYKANRYGRRKEKKVNRENVKNTNCTSYCCVFVCERIAHTFKVAFCSDT